MNMLSFLFGKNGTKLIELGVLALQARDGAKAHDHFRDALDPTLGTQEYMQAVTGLAKAYQSVSNSADLSELKQIGADALAVKRDSRFFKDDAFTEPGKRAMKELRSRLAVEIKSLPKI